MTERDRRTVRTDPPPDAERSLLRRARQGDDDAFGRLAAAFAQRIRRWALVLTADADDADDVLQEVLIRMHRELRRFEGRSRMTTWVYRITRNVALDMLRTRRRRNRLARKEEAGTPDPAPLPDRLEVLTRHEAAALVWSYFHDLPERQRVVFNLVDLEGHTPAEAAVLLGTSAGTVRGQLWHARRTIRDRILATHPEFGERV